ncbi:hypothetical protein M407DRAFT_4402 [Tulasnella calospora MUT 4182]|uniref:Uncharacterized protein n=1 Tax=Tulasnella calospora MUT 4182 TaxID=1051891 RepID=A0A0C3QJV2_9AGAM|nr:hypothetical protein M407DRAFT_4402 [Tulasnella calospora MUT 4182]
MFHFFDYRFATVHNYATIELGHYVAISGAILVTALGTATFTGTSFRLSMGGRPRSRTSEFIIGLDLHHSVSPVLRVPQPVYLNGEWHLECRPVIKGAVVPFLAGLFSAALIRAVGGSFFRG